MPRWIPFCFPFFSSFCRAAALTRPLIRDGDGATLRSFAPQEHLLSLQLQPPIFVGFLCLLEENHCGFWRGMQGPPASEDLALPTAEELSRDRSIAAYYELWVFPSRNLFWLQRNVFLWRCPRNKFRGQVCFLRSFSEIQIYRRKHYIYHLQYFSPFPWSSQCALYLCGHGELAVANDFSASSSEGYNGMREN